MSPVRNPSVSVLVIIGQTSTGKSALAVTLAKKFGGEIISADSRQIYRGIDHGAGKIKREEMKGVPHHLLDIVHIKTRFSAARYKKLANEKILEILSRRRLPIIVGGSGYYVDAVTKNLSFPQVPPNRKLRKNLALLDGRQLLITLEQLDPERAKSIDPKNKVRIIRAIEIATRLGKVPPLRFPTPPKYKFIKIGIKIPAGTLKKRIKLRLKKRIRDGMAIEIYKLKGEGVAWKRFRELGFDQRYTALYLRGKISNAELLEKLMQKNWQYAKRQMTWFKRDGEIRWFSLKEYKRMVEYINAEI
jgi:tRNA dimethylallyltransferase